MASYVAIRGNLYSLGFNKSNPAPQHQIQSTCNQRGLCSSTDCSCYLNSSECNDKNCCGCKASCINTPFKQVLRFNSETMSVRQITWRNVGVVTTKDVKEGELLGEYNGVFRDCSELKNNECHLHFTRQFIMGESEFYVDTKIFGNKSRFIRSSCKPTAVARPVFTSDGSFRVFIYANQNLTKNMEVTLEWGLMKLKRIKCLLECGCATLDLVSPLISDVYDSDTCDIVTSKYQKRIRKKRNLRHCCESKPLSYSLQRLREYVSEFFPDPIKNNESFVPFDNADEGGDIPDNFYQDNDPPQPNNFYQDNESTQQSQQRQPPAPYIFSFENIPQQKPPTTTIFVKEEPTNNRTFRMARDYSELKELMLQPLVHYKDVDLSKWGPETCLRLQLSFVNSFLLPPKIIEYNIKCLHLTECFGALKDDSIKVITKLTSLQSLWITNAISLVPSKINSILVNLTSLVDISFEGTCGNIVNSMNNLSTFSQLTSLNVSRGKDLKGDSVAWISSVIPSIIHLQELNLSGFHLQMDSIEALAKLPYLSNLNISNTNPKQELVNAMASLNPLTSLNFSFNNGVDNLVPLLTRHSSLHTLLVSNVSFPTKNNIFVADTQLNHICTFLPELESVDLEKWPISSNGMWQLTRLQSLRFVRLYRNQTDTFELQKFCAEMRQKGVSVETEDEEEVY